MTMRTILFILSCVLYANAHPNYCCQDNGPLQNFKCVDNSSLWVRKCKFEAYMIPQEEYNINEEDVLIMIPDGEAVSKHEYCTGKMDEKNIAMICFEDPELATSSNGISQVGIIICSSISIISLILTLAVYIILPNLRDLQGKCMMLTIFCLMMAFIFLAIAQNESDSESMCLVVGLNIYFWFISTFFWLNVVAINVWRTVVCPKLFSCKKHMFAIYNIYGWGGPITLLIILIICHHSDGDHIKPNMGQTKCWFGNSQGVRVYFYGPILTLLFLNIVMFISTAWELSKQTKNAAERKYRSHKYKMCLYFKLFILMGICWIFEPMSELLRTEGKYIWAVTDYINGLQGLIIFLLLVVFRKRVRRDLARHGGLCFRSLPKDWAIVPDEDCEELEEDVDELSKENDRPVVATTLNI